MQNPAMPRLTPQEFATALHQGRGSACLHLRHAPSEELHDIILDACLHDRAFDRQCEGPRSDWLYMLIAQDGRLCAAIIDAFEHPGDDQDCFQVANLVGLMARNGNPRAAAALRRSWAENDLAGEVAIFGLDGLPAALEVVRQLGHRLIAEPDDYVDSLDFLIGDEVLRDEVLSALRLRAPGDAGIAAYLSQHEQQAAREAQEQALTDEQREQRRRAYVRDYMTEYPAARMIELARQPGKVARGLFARFGRLAPDTECLAILEALESAREPEMQRRLLDVFRPMGLHAWNDTVWKLAHSQEPVVRLAAARAMASIEDGRIGSLARQRITDADFSAERSEELELFTNNYLPGDELLIAAALERIATDADGMHHLGMSALRVCQANRDVRLAVVAKFIYRTNPCTICRGDSVEWMKELGCLPDWIAAECRFDASADIRALD